MTDGRTAAPAQGKRPRESTADLFGAKEKARPIVRVLSLFVRQRMPSPPGLCRGSCPSADRLRRALSQTVRIDHEEPGRFFSRIPVRVGRRRR